MDNDYFPISLEFFNDNYDSMGERINNVSEVVPKLLATLNELKEINYEYSPQLSHILLEYESKLRCVINNKS